MRTLSDTGCVQVIDKDAVNASYEYHVAHLLARVGVSNLESLIDFNGTSQELKVV